MWEQYLIQNIGAMQMTWVSVLLILWTLPWKGVALWKASRSNQKWWFIALFLINTLGILEILYIFVFSKMNLKPKSDEKKSEE